MENKRYPKFVVGDIVTLKAEFHNSEEVNGVRIFENYMRSDLKGNVEIRNILNDEYTVGNGEIIEGYIYDVFITSKNGKVRAWVFPEAGLDLVKRRVLN